MVLIGGPQREPSEWLFKKVQQLKKNEGLELRMLKSRRVLGGPSGGLFRSVQKLKGNEGLELRMLKNQRVLGGGLGWAPQKLKENRMLKNLRVLLGFDTF